MNIRDWIYEPNVFEKKLMSEDLDKSRISIESAYLAEVIMLACYFHPWQQKNDGDAFRHCLWSSIIAKRSSPNWAEKWTLAHEAIQSPKDISRIMDEFNNHMGIDLVQKNPSFEVSDLIFECSQLISKGILRKVSKGELVSTTADGFNVPSIFEAISNKINEITEFLAKYFKLKSMEIDEDGNTALHRCIVEDYEYGFNVLVAILDVDRPGNSGRTPLMICAELSYGFKYAGKLIQNKADTNIQDKNNGETALMLAAAYNNKEMVNLLHLISNKKMKSFNGFTAYDIAMSEGNLEIAKLLMV